MKLEVRVPEEYVGAVMGDLNSRRAKVQGMEPLARGVLVRALCPHAEAMTYDADLRSLTQGAGYFTWSRRTTTRSRRTSRRRSSSGGARTGR